MSKAKTLLEGMGINPLEKIDNNCDSYWTLYELIDHCVDQFSIPVVGNSTAREMYDQLKKEIIEATEKIDKETIWQNHEPDWWTEMMDLQKEMR